MRHTHDRVAEIDRLVLEHVDPRAPEPSLLECFLRGSETRETVRGARPAARLEPCDKANPVVNGTSKVISLISLEPLGAPCIMFNSNGFYDSPHILFNRTGNMGSPRRASGREFISQAQLKRWLAS